jgi:hypothetical protein
MLSDSGYFNVANRRREKQESRERDESLIVEGLVSAEQIAQRNGFFSALDPSLARIVQRHVRVRIAA